MGLKVLSMIDSLVAAGAERMAVNIANALAEKGFDSHLCATRCSGPLAEFFYDPTKLMVAGKRNLYDFKAFFRIVVYVRKHQIQVLHAHSSSIYWACLLKIVMPRLVVIWHDHFGFSDYLERRTSWGLKLCKPLIDHVFVVNKQLYNYAVDYLKIPFTRVTLLLNFPDLDMAHAQLTGEFPNIEMYPKYVCLANLRPQKDHHTLLDAFRMVMMKHAAAQLYLVGGDYADAYLEGVKQHIMEMDSMQEHVHLLGSRNDIAGILQNCQVGILSSISEGLPVSLLEYGLAGLPVVSTEVGECTEVLDNGRLGLLVESRHPQQLAEAMIQAAEDGNEIENMAHDFQREVVEKYSKDSAVKCIGKVYDGCLN